MKNLIFLISFATFYLFSACSEESSKSEKNDSDKTSEKNDSEKTSNNNNSYKTSRGEINERFLKDVWVVDDGRGYDNVVKFSNNGVFETCNYKTYLNGGPSRNMTWSYDKNNKELTVSDDKKKESLKLTFVDENTLFIKKENATLIRFSAHDRAKYKKEDVYRGGNNDYYPEATPNASEYNYDYYPDASSDAYGY